MVAYLAALACAVIALVSADVLYQNKMTHTEYDYIIIGAGSAGSVIANRLSRSLNNKVLLLEAGGLPPEVSEIPLLAYQMTGTDVDWKYVTEPQTNACLGYENQTNPMPRGKMLGGCSSINCLLYVRGNPEDFNDWARQGATGWTWPEVYYYFLKSENMTNVSLLGDGHHKSGGPLVVSTNVYKTPIRDVILEAGRRLRVYNQDYNGAKQSGLGIAEFTTLNGHRWSTEKAFLRPAARRRNLDILYNAFVKKIEFERTTARRVNFDFQNTSHSVVALKEIVLSAGAIGSPQLLMLSGIGPRKHLKELQIPVVVDLPVGQNFQDHVRNGELHYTFNKTVGLVYSRDVNNDSYRQFLHGKGPETVPCGVEVLDFVRTKYENGTNNRPDIELTFLNPVVYPTAGKSQLDLSDKDVLAISSTLVRPQSRGFIKLRSSNPYDHPIIDPKYLTDEEDALRIIEGVKAARSIMESSVFAKYGTKFETSKAPGCEDLDMDTEEYWKCEVRSLTHSCDHQCCSCRMGEANDPDTVVDPLLRVKGVKSLRVADASVMPSVTTGNTNAPSIMIGEKAADLILGLKWDPKHKKLVNLDN